MTPWYADLPPRELLVLLAAWRRSGPAMVDPAKLAWLTGLPQAEVRAVLNGWFARRYLLQVGDAWCLDLERFPAKPGLLASGTSGLTRGFGEPFPQVPRKGVPHPLPSSLQSTSPPLTPPQTQPPNPTRPKIDPTITTSNVSPMSPTVIAKLAEEVGTTEVERRGAKAATLHPSMPSTIPEERRREVLARVIEQLPVGREVVGSLRVTVLKTERGAELVVREEKYVGGYVSVDPTWGGEICYEMCPSGNLLANDEFDPQSYPACGIYRRVTKLSPGEEVSRLITQLVPCLRPILDRWELECRRTVLRGWKRNNVIGMIQRLYEQDDQEPDRTAARTGRRRVTRTLAEENESYDRELELARQRQAAGQRATPF